MVRTTSCESSQSRTENSLARLLFWCWTQGTALGKCSSRSKKWAMGACSSYGSTKQSPRMLSAKPSGVSEMDCVCPSRHSCRYCGSAQRSNTSSPSSISVTTHGTFFERNFLKNHSGLNVISLQLMRSISEGSHSSAVSSIFRSRAGSGCEAAARAGSIQRRRGVGEPEREKVASGWAQSPAQRVFELQWHSMRYYTTEAGISHAFQLLLSIAFEMSSFKSPELILEGKIVKVLDSKTDEECSFYVKARFFEGEDWKLLSGSSKFETFESEAVNGVAPLEQPFALSYTTTAMRGWPRLLIEVWRVDEYGRHNIHGYGTLAVPMTSGWHSLEVPCWRPMGTWYDRFIGANSELQYPDIVASSLSKYGLRTISGCRTTLELNVIGRNFHLHGVAR